MVTISPKLATIVHKYELSGNGVGQRSEEEDYYGCVDLEKCVDGDTRGNYIESGSNSSYLLYWWYKLDVEGCMQFMIFILDKFHRANSTDFQLVSSKHSSPSQGDGRKEDMKHKIMTETMGRIGDEGKTRGVITARR